jgi:hypothetical protein
MPVHRINLHGPWKLERGDAADGLAERIRLPVNWEELFAAQAGGAEADGVRLTRTFHRPTNLEPNDEVELVFEHWPGAWSVSFNQRRVGELRDSTLQSPQRIRVTTLLEPTNTLSAEMRFDGRSGHDVGRQPNGQVALEIRSL